MIRQTVAHTLVSLILLAQIGLPVHMHYCKGMLESVSVFFNLGCDDHAGLTDLPVCCQSAASSHCTKEGDNCCDDEVKVLSQDITSIPPHLDKWVDVAVDAKIPSLFTSVVAGKGTSSFSHQANGYRSGPPPYILYHSLILYA